MRKIKQVIKFDLLKKNLVEIYQKFLIVYKGEYKTNIFN